MEQKINFTKDKISYLLKKIAIPAATGTLFQSLYTLVDTFYAGKISANALIALSKAFPITFVIIAFGVGILAGTTSLIANTLGEKDDYKAATYLAQSVLYSFLIYILVAFIGLNFASSTLSFMGTEEVNILLTLEYIEIIFLGSIFFFLQVSLNSVLNAQGDTKSYRNILIISFFLNIILNPLFVFGFGIIPAFGVSGLAIATIISQFISLVYILAKVLKSDIIRLISLKFFLIKINLILDLLKQGMPITVSLMLIGLGIYNILFFVSKFGDIATAGYGVALRIEQLLLLPTIGLNTAVLSITGQNFGAKKYGRIGEVYFKAIFYGVFTMLVAGLFIFFSGNFLIQLFTNNPEVIYFGVQYLKIAALIGPVYPIFFITNAFFQGIKKPIYSTYINLFRIVILPFATMWLILNYFNGGFVDLFLGLLVINWIFGIFVIIIVKYIFLRKLVN
ncbi:MatE efflux family protein [Candidatus Pelagibacter sp. IMCC9063]|uniref:MATE family efflux transporter n=1 Tax=Pelagibacter sp. (strain IMCC9063) TaxID=1002672 RepID=UPI0002046666|nr:MATE family efflux transporter [Candidatus Pelagibacter sp. IMCC9063]AEA80743.1 MatE efflux family protein [Candidatus Pelagibacter sp. IMCC9063]